MVYWHVNSFITSLYKNFSTCMSETAATHPRAASCAVLRFKIIILGHADDMAIEINPQLAKAWYNKSNALKLLGRTTEADVAFAKAMDLGYPSRSQL